MAFVLAHILQCPHVMQTVSKLYHDNADILCHCKEHLAVVLQLDILLGHILDAPKLRHAVDERHDVFAELRLHLLQCCAGILHNIVQKCRTDRLIVEMKPCEDVCDIERVNDVGISRDAHLSAMRLLRTIVRLFDLINVCVCLIGAHLFQYHSEGDIPLHIV